MSTNCLRFWGTSSQDPYQGFASGQHWGISVPQTAWAIAPQIKIPGKGCGISQMRSGGMVWRWTRKCRYGASVYETWYR